MNKKVRELIAKELVLVAKDLVGGYNDEITKDIRNDLKKLGLGRREVSVRNLRGGLSTAVKIQFKMSRDEIPRDIMNGLKKIERKYGSGSDELYDRKGEPLVGGGTFIFIEDMNGNPIKVK